MSDARRMGKSELFSHFAERFEVKRTQAREFFDELTQLAEKELKRSGDQARASYVTVTTVLIPPRTVKSPTTVMRRGWMAATRSSRISLVACS